MKKNHNHFIHHLRSYRTFYFMFFTFILLITSIVIYIFSDKIYAADLLEQAFQPAMTNETIINLGAGKNAVGNEILRQGAGADLNLGAGCDINGQRSSTTIITAQKNAVGYTGSDSSFCNEILGGTWNSSSISISGTTQAPLIVRIAKFLLRITMVLSVTMVIFNGIMRIIESAKGAEVKDAKKNITLIVVGILISLMSLSIINLISSLTVSSLGTTPSGVSTCLINGNILSGEPLKEYICNNATFGHPEDTLQYREWKYLQPFSHSSDTMEQPSVGGNRCWICDSVNTGCKWKKIYDSETISKCIELGGEYKN
ncbi:MAG: hypothetical protein NT085_04285 [candidate division SR1 bacterium]|nr:hypothetical protein [candidate division SR1 bacterium]